MKSIFDSQTRDETIRRIDALQSTSKAQWGVMTVDQMLRHCIICEQYYFGEVPVKRSFLGRLIGPFAIKGILKDEATKLGRNAPTSSTFKVLDHPENFDAEKAKWRSLIGRYGSYDKNQFVHWFFGRMTREQMGQFIYKHCDHHLRQFGV